MANNSFDLDVTIQEMEGSGASALSLELYTAKCYTATSICYTATSICYTSSSICYSYDCYTGSKMCGYTFTTSC